MVHSKEGKKRDRKKKSCVFKKTCVVVSGSFVKLQQG
jgi:hypothetical protein